MFNLERLRVLHEISVHGTVGGAAGALYVTTSAISQQMAKLERETGEQLLFRSGRGIRLTDAGRLLADHAGKVLSLLEVAQADLEAHRGRAAGELMLSAFPTAARGLFPAALAQLRREHPQLRPRLTESEAEVALPRLVRGTTDLALVLDWHNRELSLPAGLSRAPLLEDPIDLALPSGHPLAGRRRVELTEVADEEWISWPEGEFCHDWLMRTLRGEGIEPRLSHEAAEHHTQLALVAAGMGVAVTPRLGRGPVPQGVALVPVHHTLRRRIHAVWRTDADRRPSIRAAVAALEKAAREITP
ncbi:LysR family transcriptional regulator [Streptomyces winkii]|uniref:LysR family transcriptional regulator n=1 Tax=Streptomyces winkii TaxID=3051178 RepID=UPI0028D4DEC9|nr:LysR family transcriptional regulator [Streptomyces sp. DSM 40971]